MVRGRAHGAASVVTSRETTTNGSCETALAVSSVINTLEEDEGGWVRRSGGVKAVAEGLTGDVSVANDVATLEGLRSSIVGNIGVGEGTGHEVGDLDSDAEVRVGWNGLTGLREGHDGGDHVRAGGDIAHD